MAAQDPQVVEPQEFIAAIDYQFSGNDATVENKRTFLRHYTDCHTIYVAASRTGINKVTVYRWRDSDPAFAEAMDDAEEDSTDALETCMYERAKEKDTIAGIFLLKGYRPKFRDRVTVDLAVLANEVEERVSQAVSNRTLPCGNGDAIPPTPHTPQKALLPPADDTTAHQ